MRIEGCSEVLDLGLWAEFPSVIALFFAKAPFFQRHVYD
jgi:hypothetical protein